MAKIAFIQEELRERFGIMILSAVLKQGGHQCEVFVQERSAGLVQEVIAFQPDVIAFSTMTAGAAFTHNLAPQLKKQSSALIVMGGPHPTFYPEVINEAYLDAICIGEGEYAFLALMDALDKKQDYTKTNNFWFKKDGKIIKNGLQPLADVNSLPMYDRALYYEKFPELKQVPTRKFFLVRGCPFNCTYCFNHALKKIYQGGDMPFVRYLDPDKIIQEMKYTLKKYGGTWVQFNGDTININRKWFMTFLEKYKKEIDMPFLCNVRIERVDEEMVKKMKEAGCDRVDFGVEHGDETIRRDILKRNMTNQQIIDGGKLFRKYGIRVQTANIIGVPGETVESAMKTVRLNRHFKPELARCFVLQPYPRTEIYDYAVANGYLDESDAFSNLGTGFQIGFDGSAEGMTLKLKEAKQLTNLYYFFNALVRHKWLEPIIRLLLKLPPNRFFLFVHALPIVSIDVKYHKSWKRKLESLKGLFRVLIK